MGAEIKQDSFGGKVVTAYNTFKYYFIIFVLIFVYAIALITIVLPRIEDQQTRMMLLAITYVLYIVILALVVIFYLKGAKKSQVIVRTRSVPKASDIVPNTKDIAPKATDITPKTSDIVPKTKDMTTTMNVKITEYQKVVPAEAAESHYILEFIVNDDSSNDIDALFNPQQPVITHEIFKANTNNKKELVDKAFAEYMGAISQNPQDYKAHNNLGNVYVYKNMFDEAVNEYLEAVRIKPNSYKILSNLGAACYLTNKFDDAAVVLKQSLKIKPDFSPAHNNLGLVNLEKRAFDEAIWEFQSALKYDPTNKEAKLNLDRSIQVKKASLHEGVAGSLP